MLFQCATKDNHENLNHILLLLISLFFFYLQFGELFSLVARILSVDEFGEEELPELGSLFENGRTGQRRSEEGHVVPRRHAHLVTGIKRAR